MSGRKRLMKAGPGILLASSVAGFAGVLTLHGLASGSNTAATSTAASPAAAAGPPGQGTPSRSATSHQASGPARSATGPGVQYGYGTLAVRVTVRGSHITGLTIASLQTLEPTSQMISAQAIPLLRSEVIAAQSTNVQGVTGASYTSAAYLRSAQAALDALHAG